MSGCLIIFITWRLINLDSLRFDNCSNLDSELEWPILSEEQPTYSMLKSSKIGRTQGIGLGDDGDQVDSRAQAFHDFDIQGFQCMAGGSDKVEAGMNTEINFGFTARLLLLKHIRLMLVVQEFYDWHPRVTIVDVVSEARGINDSQAH